MRMLKQTLRTLDTRTAKPLPKQTDRYYGSAEHKAWAAEVLKRDGGICRDPQHKGPKEGLRCVADHIEERRDRPDLQLNLSNGITRCWSCHTRKTMAERARRAVGRPTTDAIATGSRG